MTHARQNILIGLSLSPPSVRRGVLVVSILAYLIAGGSDTLAQAPQSGGESATGSHPAQIELDRSRLPEAAYGRIESLNVRGADLRDLLRGIGSEYGLNVIVDDGLRQSVTVQLVDLPVIDALVFLAEEHGLSLRHSGNVFRVRAATPPPEPEPEPLPHPEIVVVNDLLSADLVGQDVRDVVRELSLQGDANLVVRPGVRGPVHGSLREVPFERGIRALLENNGFVVRLRDGIYHVEAERRPSPNGEGQGTGGSGGGYWVSVTDSLVAFDVTDALITSVVRDIASQADLSLISYHVPEGTITARAAVSGVEEAFDLLLRGTESTYRREGDVFVIGDRSAAGIATSRLIRLGHLQASRAIEMIPDAVRQRADIELVREHNGLMVTGSRDVITEIANVIAEIDHPTPQILIEALVVDFEGFNTFELGVTVGRDGRRAAESNGAPFTWGDGENQQGGFDIRASGRDTNNALSHVVEAGVRLGAGDFVQWIGRLPADFFARIRALAAEGKAEVRSRPQISTLNGHEASLTIGTTQYYILRTSTPITSPGDVLIQETERFETVEANVTLRVLPWVSANGEVTAEIRPEFSTPVGGFQAGVPPTINTRVLESTVRLQDGETIILGGLIQESEIVHHNKIPILGDIPLIGRLFRNRSRETRTTEMVIFLTPHVFYGDERDAAKWRGLRDHLGVEGDTFEPRDAPRGWSGTRVGPDADHYGPLREQEEVLIEDGDTDELQEDEPADGEN